MKTYNVELKVTKIFFVEQIRAKSEEDAIEKAWNQMEKKPESYYSDTETEAEADEE
jgi:hypothetical protein